MHVNLGVTVYAELFPLHRFGSRTNGFAIVLFLAGAPRRHKCCRSSATILVYPFGPMPRPRYRRDHAGLRQENWCQCVRAYKRHKQGAIIYSPTHLHRNWTGSPYGNSTISIRTPTQTGYANPGQNRLLSNRPPDPFPTPVGFKLAFPILIVHGGGDGGSKRSRTPSPNRPNFDRFGNGHNSNHSGRPKFGRNRVGTKLQVWLQVTNYPKLTKLWSKNDLIFYYSDGHREGDHVDCRRS